jgi:hypothetical protein
MKASIILTFVVLGLAALVATNGNYHFSGVLREG